MTTATTKKAKTKKTPKVAKAGTKAATKKESVSREDPRVGILLTTLIRNPAATHDDLVGALKAKGESMSASAVRLVRRGFVQTLRALTAANMIAT
jgi:hypothetical protein